MITFVSTAYKEKKEANIFLNSLLLQTNENWKCIICCDGKNEYIENIVKNINDERIKIHLENKPNGFWGHKNRKFALENLVDTDFIIQTSIQDYYCPITVSSILDLSNSFDFIYFNCIHNHQNYRVLNSLIRANSIDWGSFAVRTEIAKKVGIFDIESGCCDGIFAERCGVYPNIRIFKLDKVLTVHN